MHAFSVACLREYFIKVAQGLTVQDVFTYSAKNHENNVCTFHDIICATNSSNMQFAYENGMN